MSNDLGSNNRPQCMLIHNCKGSWWIQSHKVSAWRNQFTKLRSKGGWVVSELISKVFLWLSLSPVTHSRKPKALPRHQHVTALQRSYQYLHLRHTYGTKRYGYSFESWVLCITCVVTCIVTCVVCFLQQLAYVLDRFIREFIKSANVYVDPHKVISY